MAEPQEEEIKYFVRVRNTDLDGTKSVQTALTRIAGIGRHTAVTIAQIADVDPHAIMGKLDESKVERIRQAVENYAVSVPEWMMNRPKDIYTGETRHLFATEVQLAVDEDVNRMRKIRSYRGIRHETGQKVRGQRTKSTGRTGATVGVKRKKD
ncbi:MAG: 30S ribosomal protein S13 [Methanomicrobiales archaeon]|nr:30S ribosomal protein S13 [Methanomicrobiales archaeon]MDI6875418.1 30S ribosomal protein S13 [Methanomicrobiales archaeon]